jgi:hypothetical protein
VLLPLLNRYTLVEFKGPTDLLDPGDVVAQLVGCAFLWHSQQAERIPHEDISLVVLAPRMNDGAREELQSLGWQAREQSPGLHCVTAAPFGMWVVETDVMAELGSRSCRW